jgi:glycosyltransferase involved in cell wall biosynthesis
MGFMNKPLRVLHIITRLDPGGSATNTIETAARLDRRRFDVFLISGLTADIDNIEALLKAKNIPYVFFSDLQREIHPWKDIKAFFQLYTFIRRRHFDIVHTHSSKAGILGRWAAKCAGVKVIIHTPHGHIFYGYFSKALTRIFIWIERITALITDRIITLTNRGKKEHIEFKIGHPDQFITIYSGIDMGKIVEQSLEQRSLLKSRFNIPQKSFIIGSVARLDPIKGTAFLIDAMAKVIKGHPQAHLLLVGDGSERVKLENQCAALGLQNHVSFVGFQPDPQPFIEIMDVFVLASLNEGMGRVLLEARMLSKPVIATHVGGISEIVDDGKNGFLVPPKDTDALNRRILQLIEDPILLKSMANETKIKAGERFSLERMVCDIEAVYENCMKRGFND